MPARARLADLMAVGGRGVFKAVILFDSCLKTQSERLAREEPDDWGHGGVMPQHFKSKSMQSTKSLADRCVHSQLARGEKLSFVYDFVGAGRPFSSLNFVHNAARKPLQEWLPSEEFEQTYGLPQRLCFKAASEQRPAAEHDYWTDLYAP